MSLENNKLKLVQPPSPDVKEQVLRIIAVDTIGKFTAIDESSALTIRESV